jgi:hypothetical protein
MNEVWDAWLSPGNAPARATVESKLAAPDFTVEIMVIGGLRGPARLYLQKLRSQDRFLIA